MRLWSEVCKVLLAVGKPQNGRLDSLESLMLAGCKSKHVPVLTMAANTWNRMTSAVDDPDCSDSLKSVLSSLASEVDLDMISGELSSNESGAQAPASSGQHGSDHVEIDLRSERR